MFGCTQLVHLVSWCYSGLRQTLGRHGWCSVVILGQGLASFRSLHPSLPLVAESAGSQREEGKEPHPVHKAGIRESRSGGRFLRHGRARIPQTHCTAERSGPLGGSADVPGADWCAADVRYALVFGGDGSSTRQDGVEWITPGHVIGPGEARRNRLAFPCVP